MFDVISVDFKAHVFWLLLLHRMCSSYSEIN